MDEVKPQTQNLLVNVFREGWFVLLIAVFIGLASYGIKMVTGSPFADPLFIALLLGIITRMILGESRISQNSFKLALAVLIPIGTILYGAINLNFVQFSKVDPKLLFLMIATLLAYFVVVVGLGKLLNQGDKTTYLIATGSAVCGASAIAITAPAVEAEPDDVSISLIAVFIAGIFGLFILFPFIANLFDMTDQVYALLSATTLQFTGFVKVAVSSLPKELSDMAVSIKATRYMFLFLAIPLFSSLIRGKFYIPWFLWIFLAAGLAFSFLPNIFKPFLPVLKPTLDILWAIAMATIGLNANAMTLISDSGLKALFMAISGFVAAITVSLFGISMIF